MKRRLVLTAVAGAFFHAGISGASEFAGGLDLTGQSIRGDTASSKFEEYEDVPRGFYVNRVCVDLSSGAYSFMFKLSKPGLRDQRFDVEGGVWGMHKLSASYDQIPHNYSNTAQTLLRNDGDGTFTLPDNMQSSLQTSSANAPGFLPWSPFIPLRVDRKKGSLAYAYNPTGRWRMNVAYAAEKKEGAKAIGITYGHGQVQEAPEPVDYQTHSASLGAEYVGDSSGFTASYEVSSFQNSIKALTVDNPFQLSDGALSASGSSTPGRARLALPPDNQTHRFGLAYSAKLPLKSRLETAFSYGFQQQDDPFLPLTVNGIILNDARLPGLPAPSLNGEVYTYNGSAKWNWKPTEAISVNLKGRQNTVDNRTPSLDFRQYVSYDTSFSTGTPTSAFNPTRRRRSLPLDYAKTNIGADVYYSLAKPLSMKLAYDWERYKRHYRESETTKENSYTLALNYKPLSGLVIRPSYLYSRKTEQGYDADRVAHGAFPLGEGTALGQIPGLRKYDQAGRKRNKVSLRAEWSPADSLSAGADYGLLRDDFETEYGLLNSRTEYLSVDASLNPVEAWTLYADYTWELMTSRTRSRYRTSTVDLEANDWLGLLEDKTHTVSVGTNYAMLEDKLDAGADWSMTYSKGIQLASNPNTITTASALATNLPNTYTRLNKIRANLRYRWTKSLLARLGYEYQRYTETDWSQDTLDVYQTDWNKSVFLGASQAGYKAHLVSLGLSYLF